MTVISSDTDLNEFTLTVVAEFAAPIDRVWQVWANPRTLERWWGPPTWPATFVDHELVEGSRSVYYMTGPDGTQSWGWWEIGDVNEPTDLAFIDGFAKAGGEPDPSIAPTPATVTLVDDDGTTRMTIVTNFE